MFRTVSLSETCRILFQNILEKLMHLVGFITINLKTTGLTE